MAHRYAGNWPKVALLTCSQPDVIRRVELAGPFNAGQVAFRDEVEEGIVVGAIEAEDGFDPASPSFPSE